MILPIGTFINMGSVIAGGLLGLLLKNFIPEKFKTIVFQGIGLFSIALGISMYIGVENPLFVIFALLIGGLIGEAVKLEDFFNSISEKVKKKFNLKESKFTEGLITSTLLYCIGSMTVLGAIEEGTGGGYTLLVTKSVMDGFASIALASTFGIGVLFSIIPMLVYQGGLTILASALGNLLSDTLIQYLSAVGGLLILGIGINMLDIKKIKVANLLPSLIVVVILYVIF
jgi:hypothetical protein